MNDDREESKSASDAVAVGLAILSVILAAVVFAAEAASTGPMQFIETGDGSMEVLAMVVLVAIITMLGLRLTTK
jgi:high-affinity Fe2+/Pb2+ permease